MNAAILTIVTFLPLAGALALLLFPRCDVKVRWFALSISLLDFVLSLHLPFHFDYANPGFQFDVNVPWISTPAIHYHLHGRA